MAQPSSSKSQLPQNPAGAATQIRPNTTIGSAAASNGGAGAKAAGTTVSTLRSLQATVLAGGDGIARLRIGDVDMDVKLQGSLETGSKISINQGQTPSGLRQWSVVALNDKPVAKPLALTPLTRPTDHVQTPKPITVSATALGDTPKPVTLQLQFSSSSLASPNTSSVSGERQARGELVQAGSSQPNQPPSPQSTKTPSSLTTLPTIPSKAATAAAAASSLSAQSTSATNQQVPENKLASPEQQSKPSTQLVADPASAQKVAHYSKAPLASPAASTTGNMQSAEATLEQLQDIALGQSKSVKTNAVGVGENTHSSRPNISASGASTGNSLSPQISQAVTEMPARVSHHQAGQPVIDTGHQKFKIDAAGVQLPLGMTLKVAILAEGPNQSAMSSMLTGSTTIIHDLARKKPQIAGNEPSTARDSRPKPAPTLTQLLTMTASNPKITDQPAQAAPSSAFGAGGMAELNSPPPLRSENALMPTLFLQPPIANEDEEWRHRFDDENEQSLAEQADEALVIDFTLSELSSIRIISRASSERYDVRIASEGPLPAELKLDLHGLVLGARELAGVDGQLQFQSKPAAKKTSPSGT